jgi:16S rRNA (adenine1518-N6/adenine1519-N6)-dimethyltransferase
MRQKPKKRLGQNFLVDKNIQEKIIRSSNLKKSDIVLEIGPGRGELTQAILDKVKKLVAVEIDKGLCAHLKEKFSSCGNFVLMEQDILKTDLSCLAGGKGSGKLKVIANIPYYITTPVISHLLEFRSIIRTIFLTVQKELALRLTAHPGSKDFGAFSCFVQFYARPRLIFHIRNNSFWPRPKVDSCFVELRVFSKPIAHVNDEKLFFKIIRTGFGQRRKFLRNSLAKEFSAEDIRDCFKAVGIKEAARPENLSLWDFAGIADYLAGE